MTPVHITASADARLDDFRDLIAADSAEPRREIVIAEGVNVVERAIRSGSAVRAVVGVAAKLAALSTTLARTDIPVYEVDKWLLSDVAGFRVTRGVIASVQRPPARAPEQAVARGSRFVVLEAINDFENLGSIFRNAAAFGVDAVLLDSRCADPLYRRSVRVSMGYALTVPFAVLPQPWPASLELLRQRQVELLGLTPAASAQTLRSTTVGAKWAVLLGAEGPGLSAAAIQACDRLVRIPMADGVDSLNVATAGAVALAQLTI